MFRWRCWHKPCARKRAANGGRAYARRSTKKKIAPVCACGSTMKLDKKRTSREESRRNNCHCSEQPWSARGGPHSRSSCRAKIKRDFEESQHELPLRDGKGRFVDDGVPF